MTTPAMSTKQISKLGQLWQQWHTIHGAATQALSSAVNIHGRLKDLSDPLAFSTASQQQQQQQQQPGLPEQGACLPTLQELVVGKQLLAMDRALAMLREQHQQLQVVVRDMERLYIEVSRSLGSGSALTAVAVPQGPEPSLLQVVEAMQDAWMMCRDELLLKMAVLGLVNLDATPQHMAALLSCYQDQPNIQRSKIDAIVGVLQETRLQDVR